MTSRASALIVVIAALAGTVVACGSDSAPEEGRKQTTSHLEGDSESTEEDGTAGESAAAETEATEPAQDDGAVGEGAEGEGAAAETEVTEPAAQDDAAGENSGPDARCQGFSSGRLCDSERGGFYVCESGVVVDYVGCDLEAGMRCIFAEKPLAKCRNTGGR